MEGIVYELILTESEIDVVSYVLRQTKRNTHYNQQTDDYKTNDYHFCMFSKSVYMALKSAMEKLDAISG